MFHKFKDDTKMQGNNSALICLSVFKPVVVFSVAPVNDSRDGVEIK